MFTTPTVIILGAGASFEFGAPLGAGLWGRIANDTAQLARTYDEYFSQKIVVRSNAQVVDDHRVRNPKASAYFAEVIEQLGNHDVIDGIMQSKGFAARIPADPRAILHHIAKRVAAENVHTSVDDYLRDNPSMLPVLRVLMAAALFEGLYEQESGYPGQWKRKHYIFTSTFNLPQPGKDRPMVDNWLQKFVGTCRPLLISAGKNITPVTVISFNYDLVMTTVLSHYWPRAERQYPEFSECFKFLYPYGCFSEFPETVNEPSVWLRQQAKGIGLANGEENGDAKAVRDAINAAKQVFAIGFSFTETNIALLGLNPEHSQRLFVQNYCDRDTRLKRLLETRFPGTKSDAAPLAQLVSDGFFEQRGYDPPHPRVTRRST